MRATLALNGLSARTQNTHSHLIDLTLHNLCNCLVRFPSIQFQTIKNYDKNVLGYIQLVKILYVSL